MFFKNNPGKKLMNRWTREEKCAARAVIAVYAARKKSRERSLKKLGRPNYRLRWRPEKKRYLLKKK